MKPPRSAPVLGAFGRIYLVYSSAPGLLQGPFVGRVEGSDSILQAAQHAAEMLFFRQSVRQVAALVSERRGVFIAFGKAAWIRHPKGPKGRLDEVRFLIQLQLQPSSLGKTT